MASALAKYMHIWLIFQIIYSGCTFDDGIPNDSFPFLQRPGHKIRKLSQVMAKKYIGKGQAMIDGRHEQVFNMGVTDDLYEHEKFRVKPVVSGGEETVDHNMRDTISTNKESRRNKKLHRVKRQRIMKREKGDIKAPIEQVANEKINLSMADKFPPQEKTKEYQINPLFIERTPRIMKRRKKHIVHIRINTDAKQRTVAYALKSDKLKEFKPSTTVKPNARKSTTDKPDALKSITDKPKPLTSTAVKPNLRKSTANKPRTLLSPTVKPNALKFTNKPKTLTLSSVTPNARKSTDQPKTLNSSSVKANARISTIDKPKMLTSTTVKSDTRKSTADKSKTLMYPTVKQNALKSTNKPKALTYTSVKPNARKSADQPEALTSSSVKPNARQSTTDKSKLLTSIPVKPNTRKSTTDRPQTPMPATNKSATGNPRAVAVITNQLTDEPETSTTAMKPDQSIQLKPVTNNLKSPIPISDNPDKTKPVTKMPKIPNTAEGKGKPKKPKSIVWSVFDTGKGKYIINYLSGKAVLETDPNKDDWDWRKMDFVRKEGKTV